jgi:hypothetical protein
LLPRSSEPCDPEIAARFADRSGPNPGGQNGEDRHAFGGPAGSGKHVVERLTLTEDRLHIRYELTVEDPEYLTAPGTYTVLWAHRPDLEPSEPCDAEVALRYLDE